MERDRQKCATANFCNKLLSMLPSLARAKVGWYGRMNYFVRDVEDDVAVERVMVEEVVGQGRIGDEDCSGRICQSDAAVSSNRLMSSLLACSHNKGVEVREPNLFTICTGHLAVPGGCEDDGPNKILRMGLKAGLTSTRFGPGAAWTQRRLRSRYGMLVEATCSTTML